VVRCEVWWAALPEPAGSGPGYRRPVLVVSSDSFNRSRISTLVVAAITSDSRLADAPGNVLVPARSGGLAKASVVNVSQLLTLDKSYLSKRIGRLSPRQMALVDDGIRLVLGL
jgi:mRNA interferase MazF